MPYPKLRSVLVLTVAVLLALLAPRSQFIAATVVAGIFFYGLHLLIQKNISFVGKVVTRKQQKLLRKREQLALSPIELSQGIFVCGLVLVVCGFFAAATHEGFADGGVYSNIAAGIVTHLGYEALAIFFIYPGLYLAASGLETISYYRHNEENT